MDNDINKPIESAPKDGTSVYVFNREKCFGLCAEWNDTSKRWEGIWFGPLGALTVFWDPNDPIQPTHWRPTDSEG